MTTARQRISNRASQGGVRSTFTKGTKASWGAVYQTNQSQLAELPAKVAAPVSWDDHPGPAV